jgi:uncharacterized membrane protein YbhN (UPF0104 family)
MMLATLARARSFCARHRTPVTVVAWVATICALAAVLAGRWSEFTAAIGSVSPGVVGLAVALQVVALLARSEAWNGCVSAAGGTVSRRPLYRASSMGYVGSLVNGQLGVAARIAALRRSAPEASPRVPALIAAELPILSVEAILAALTSFTLVGPLGLPWWVPLAILAVFGGVGLGVHGFVRGRDCALAHGLAALRTQDGLARLVALVLVAVFAQIARNWLMLRAVGVDASLFDAIAVLIAVVTLSQLPVGPSVGAAAAVLILGPHGVAAAAAAGVLLTATGTVGGLSFAGWALLDRLWCTHRPHPLATARALAGQLAALPDPRRRTIELAYFGGLTHVQIARALGVPAGAGVLA